MWLVLVLPLVFRGRRRVRRAMALGLLMAVTACGSSRQIPLASAGSNPASPTPAGSYNLTVAATSAGVTHSVALTLIVQ
jgi:hypothetical protein